MSTTEPPMYLMSNAEADREMAAFFKQQNEDDIASRKADSAKLVAKDPTVNEAPVELPPEWQAVKDRLMQAMKCPKPRGPIETSGIAKMDVVTGVIAPLEDLKNPTLLLTTPASIEATIPTEKTLGTAPCVVDVKTDFGKFPFENILKVCEPSELLQEMNELCRALVKHKNYGEVRDRYCKLSIRLNSLGKLAPRFRPGLKSGAAFNDPVHKLIHRDQVVIDLHWIYATKISVSPAESSHRLLFDASSDFGFDLAWELAGKSWKNDYRAVEALCLTTFQQCQMLTLRGKELTARLQAIERGERAPGVRSVSRAATVSRLIGEWAERDKRLVLQRTHYQMLWLARESLGGKASNQQIAALHALMMGSDVQDPTTIRDKLKSLDRHVRPLRRE